MFRDEPMTTRFGTDEQCASFEHYVRAPPLAIMKVCRLYPCGSTRLALGLIMLTLPNRTILRVTNWCGLVPTCLVSLLCRDWLSDELNMMLQLFVLVILPTISLLSWLSILPWLPLNTGTQAGVPRRTGLLLRQQWTTPGMKQQTVPLLVVLPFGVPMTVIPFDSQVDRTFGMLTMELGPNVNGLRHLLDRWWQIMLMWRPSLVQLRKHIPPLMILRLLGNVSVVLAPLVRHVRLKNVEPHSLGASIIVTLLAEMKLTDRCSSCGQL